MNKINWRQDYRREFVCPACSHSGMNLAGKYKYKQLFRCPNCGKHEGQFYTFKSYEFRSTVNWRRDYKVGEFACPNPNCDVQNVVPIGRNSNKQEFICQVCKTTAFESIDLSNRVVSRLSGNPTAIKPFKFEDDVWDLRAINVNVRPGIAQYSITFSKVKQSWLKNLVKQYIYDLCKAEKSCSMVNQRLLGLRYFSHYLDEKNINALDKINRDIIHDFLNWLSGQKVGRTALRDRLGDLRSFFNFGWVKGLFNVNQDIIRDEDFPKVHKKNIECICLSVREKIEQNLHLLPESIARMWIVAFFTAMRPNELALLKKDCLIQEGEQWKIIWQRQKTNDWHEVPVTRTIAKIVREQFEYIQQLFGEQWDYLFCHYQGISQTDPSHPKLKPVKKIIPVDSPLYKAINCLIKHLDIRDENDFLAKFSPKLLRTTRLTQLFEQGHDLAVVSSWAGHKHLATTSTYYTHVSCSLIEKEAGHIQKALFNVDGKPLYYESMPKSFWENPTAHQLELAGNHINTPIYGYCGLPLNQRCDKFRACYTCSHFVATPEKLSQYIQVRNELRAKETRAFTNGHDVLVEQFGQQADLLDKIIVSLQEVA